MNINFRITSLTILVCTSLASFAQTSSRQPKALSLDPAVRTGKLSNGFTYHIRHNEEPKNRVIFYLATKAGSILETDEQRGLAHFMEHMSFNGTAHFPKNELVDYLQKSGVKFGADLNAYTSFDETVYQLPLPSDQPALLQGGLQIMRDWAHEAILDTLEINKERGVILEEKRLGKGAGQRMRDVYFPLLLNHSRYAERLPIGVDTVLNHFRPAVLKDFYQDWYRPDLQALIVVGDVNVDEMEKSIKAKFGDLKNPVKEKVRTIYSVPLTGRNQFITVTDPENKSTFAEVLIKHREEKLSSAADYRNSIIRSLFNDMLSARYEEILRQSAPPYINGGGGISNFLNSLDVYSAVVTARPGELEQGLKALWRETIRVKRFGFTAPELERAKKGYLNVMEFNFKEQGKIASNRYVNEYLQYFLKGVAAPGIAEEYRLTQSYLPTISVKEFDAISKEYIRSVDRDILITAPEKEKAALPDRLTVEKWLAQVEAESLQPYKDEVSSLPLLSHVPVAGKIVKEENDETLQITMLTLSNGVKVLLKPTDFQNEQIMFNGSAPGGSSLYSDADFASAAFASAVTSIAGVGNYNATELRKYLSDKQAGVGVQISEHYQSISGGTVMKDMETAMQLVYANFTAPRIDKALFEGFVSRNKANLANRANDPNSVFSDSVNAVWNQGSMRRAGLSVKMLDQINPERSLEIYKELFSDASNFTFIFIGSFKIDELKPLLEKYLGGLPATHQEAHYKDLGIHPPEGRIEKAIYKGTAAKATVNLAFSGRFDYSAAEKVQLDALKEVLQIRLIERLREDESGVYSPGVGQSVTKDPDARYMFTISFGCAPQNVDKLIASVLDEVNKLKVSGPPQVNVDKYKAEYRRTHETELKSNLWWFDYLVTGLQNQADLHELNSYERDLEQVSPASLKVLAGKYLSGENFIRMVLLPEK
ncbi:zinc protease [Chitinophaga sp. YR627]|uniref:M16 family metallopeptidase n=1 Tax=Chitinophaga sp. YR627 TaxID=1881041 RepID=UPI0008E94B9F|nr:insulinase family protein [Chitinophaga sp. YR627]SFO52003.1 zinc protease [Chitinophaga sp. YR627]